MHKYIRRKSEEVTVERRERERERERENALIDRISIFEKMGGRCRCDYGDVKFNE